MSQPDPQEGRNDQETQDPLDRLPLRLHIDHLRLEGTAAGLLGPVMESELAAEIELRLAELIRAHGAPPLATAGPLRLDGATVRLDAGVSREGAVAAIARQLYEQIYGPLDPWGIFPGEDEMR